MIILKWVFQAIVLQFLTCIVTKYQVNGMLSTNKTSMAVSEVTNRGLAEDSTNLGLDCPWPFYELPARGRCARNVCWRLRLGEEPFG